ncbi:HAD family phosphatase [bacterium]|nr:HAD family phosphatase [bacterium]
MSTATPDAGVIFDLDGVIIDSEALQHRAYNLVLRRFGIEVDAVVYGREWIAAGRGPEYAVRELGLPISASELRRLKDPVYHELLRREIQLIPGARAALERLRPRFPLAVATNSHATDVDFVLARFALTPLFTAVVTREHYVEAKPAPDAFATAAARLGLAPARCVVIEDATKGIRAAAAAGCACIAFPHDYTADNDTSSAQAVIRSLDELTVELVQGVLH